MRIVAALLMIALLCALTAPAIAAEDAWPPEIEQAYQDFIHPDGPRATDVLYFVPDKAAAADYYSGLLGFPLLWIEPNGPAFLMVDQQVSLSLLDVHEFGPPGWQDGDPMPPPMLGYQVDDVEAEAARLGAAGAELRLVHEEAYVKVYLANDPVYHNNFMIVQMKDDASTRELFQEMMAGMEH